MSAGTATAPAPRKGLSLPVLCLEGPTGSGKSAVADMVAARLGAELVSVDSMQIYRGMDIGTAKTPPDARPVPYHCIDILDPGEEYSAALFQRDGRRVVEGLDGRGTPCVACGGTGFYMRALVDDLEFVSDTDDKTAFRARYEQMAQERGAEAVHALLAERDPESARVIHPHNLPRVVRALEMCETGESYARRKEAFHEVGPYYPALRLALRMEPAVLAARIDARVDAMMETGLLAEVEGLLAAGYRQAATASAAIGYKELVRHLDGEISLDEAVELVKRDTRRYAKRQRTWLRGQRGIVWIDADDGDAARMADEVVRLWETALRAQGKAAATTDKAGSDVASSLPDGAASVSAGESAASGGEAPVAAALVSDVATPVWRHSAAPGTAGEGR